MAGKACGHKALESIRKSLHSISKLILVILWPQKRHEIIGVSDSDGCDCNANSYTSKSNSNKTAHARSENEHSLWLIAHPAVTVTSVNAREK